MADPIPVGRAFVWHDGEKWFYSPTSENAPDDALAAELVEIEGTLAIRLPGGQLVSGAERWPFA
jgi:hypothetical protein